MPESIGEDSLHLCVVHMKGSHSIGFLFMQTATHVVLINNVGTGTDLGPIRPVRTEHLDPEADVRVIPASMVESIKFLEGAP